MFNIGRRNVQFEEEVQAIIPAGTINEVEEDFYKEKEWTPSKIYLTPDKLIYETKEETKRIELNSIFYLDRQINFLKAREHNVLTFNFMTSDGGYLALIKTSSKRKLKRTILRQIMSGAKINYITKYQVGEKVNKDKEWKEGKYRGKGTEHVQILGEDNRLLAIPRKKILFVATEELKGKNSLKIYYEDGENENEDEVIVDVIYPVNTSVSMILQYFESCFLREEQKIPTLNQKELKVVKILNSLESGNQFLATKIAETLNLDLERFKSIITRLEEKKVIKTEDIILKLTNIGQFVGEKKSGFYDEEVSLEKEKSEEIVDLLCELEEKKREE